MRILKWEPDFSPFQSGPIRVDPLNVNRDHSRQCVAEVNNADHVFDKRSHPSVNGDKVFDKRSQSVIPIAEVFVKLPDPTLPKNTAPSSSSAGYSNNHRKKVAHSQVWKPINSTGAQNTLEQNTSKQGNNDTSLHKVDGKIDASILKADLSNLDQGPALSNSRMMHTVIEEDEQGLELSSAGQITETIVVADCEANRGIFSLDLARVEGRVVEHCEEVQGSTTSVLQQLDQVALQAPNDLSSGEQIRKVQLTIHIDSEIQDVDAINRSVGTECTSAELRNVAKCVGAEIQLPQIGSNISSTLKQIERVPAAELQAMKQEGKVIDIAVKGLIGDIGIVNTYSSPICNIEKLDASLKEVSRLRRHVKLYPKLLLHLHGLI
ncbi:hypothetical protein LIER_27064 [Lithospermum erythrorhizon]|uniref:Uncharacterized protein n=1 Tax=Lithospermum erythrorhizon TaxID=34254 RepID=A0AAV3RAR6_LITER